MEIYIIFVLLMAHSYKMSLLRCLPKVAAYLQAPLQPCSTQAWHFHAV